MAVLEVGEEVCETRRITCLDGDDIESEGRGMYHCLELMSSLPLFLRWKELGKGWPSC